MHRMQYRREKAVLSSDFCFFFHETREVSVPHFSGHCLVSLPRFFEKDQLLPCLNFLDFLIILILQVL